MSSIRFVKAANFDLFQNFEHLIDKRIFLTTKKYRDSKRCRHEMNQWVANSAPCRTNFRSLFFLLSSF